MLTPTTLLDNQDGNHGPGQFSLREAILVANANGEDDTILLGPGIYGLTLPGGGEDTAATGDLDVTEAGRSLTIRGTGANATFIDGNSLDRVFQVLGGATLHLQGLTVTGGFIQGDSGGGILNAGTLTLTRCEVSNNTVETDTGPGHGGGIHNSGNLTLTDSTVHSNAVIAYQVVYPGDGGGISSTGALTVVNSTISGNSAVGNGGGLAILSGAASLVNVTVAYNLADSNAAFAGWGAGLYAAGGADVTLTNTLLASNFLGEMGDEDVNGLLNSDSAFNLVGLTLGSIGILDGTNGNQVGNYYAPIQALLGSLGENGGPTRTHSLLSTSPALNAGTNAGAPATDQRRVLRRGAVDIGAYEDNPTAVTNTADSGPGSLRAAIEFVNAGSGAVETITFAIGDVGSVQTIRPLPSGDGVSLPVLLVPMLIDGWSQGGPGYTGPPLIELDGSLAADGLASIGLHVQANDVVIRGLAINRFVINDVDGTGILVATGSGVWIYGNYLGTAPDGVTPRANGHSGVWVTAAAGAVRIGTDGNGVNDQAERNVIAANVGAGIVLQSSGTLVAGNFIGLAADGSPLGNGGAGVRVTAGVGNAIRANAIGNNGGLGIDLGPTGPTPNDSGDADEGPNRLQNSPEITLAVFNGQLTVRFSVQTAAANATYPLTVEFFLADAGGEEGLVFLGSAVYAAAEAQTTKTVVFTPVAPLSPGARVVATATDGAGNTSEFSAAIPVQFPVPNQLPVAPTLALSATTINEGQSVTVTVRLTDPEPGESHTVVIRWGDGTPDTLLGLAPGVTAVTASHTYTDDTPAGAYRVELTVTDPSGAVATASALVTVRNVAPTLRAGPEAFLREGTLYVGGGVVTDPGADPLTVVVSFGDGSPERSVTVRPDGTFDLVHVYPGEGSFQVTVRASDGDGGAAVVTFFVHTFLAGPVHAASAVLPPGGTATLAVPGVAVVAEDGPGPDAPVSLLILALLPTDAIAQVFALTPPGGGGELLLLAFDLRGVNLDADDRATLVVEVDSPAGSPNLRFFDPQANAFLQVVGSTLVPASYLVLPVGGTTRFRITLVLDATSLPRLQDLQGTVFTVSVPVAPPLPSVTPQPILLATPPSPPSDIVSDSPAPAPSLQRTGFVSGSQPVVLAAPSQGGVMNLSAASEEDTDASDLALRLLRRMHSAYWEEPAEERAPAAPQDPAPAPGETLTPGTIEALFSSGSPERSAILPTLPGDGGDILPHEGTGASFSPQEAGAVVALFSSGLASRRSLQRRRTDDRGVPCHASLLRQ